MFSLQFSKQRSEKQTATYAAGSCQHHCRVHKVGIVSQQTLSNRIMARKKQVGGAKCGVFLHRAAIDVRQGSGTFLAERAINLDLHSLPAGLRTSAGSGCHP